MITSLDKVLSTTAQPLHSLLKFTQSNQVEQTEIKEFMKAKKIPVATQLKVKTYLATLFKAKRCFDEERVMKNLPPKLMYEVLDCLHRRQVMHVPVFKRLPEEITEAIYYALLPQVGNGGGHTHT